MPPTTIATIAHMGNGGLAAPSAGILLADEVGSVFVAPVPSRIPVLSGEGAGRIVVVGEPLSKSGTSQSPPSPFLSLSLSLSLKPSVVVALGVGVLSRVGVL